MKPYKRWYEKNKDEARRKKREAMRRYRAENPEKYRAQSRKAKKKLKDAVFDLYGRECMDRNKNNDEDSSMVLCFEDEEYDMEVL